MRVESSSLVAILPQGHCTAFSLSRAASQKGQILTMSKSLEAITEAIQNSKHPFRQLDDRPQKAHKNRYERRKVKEYIKLGDWEPQAG